MTIYKMCDLCLMCMRVFRKNFLHKEEIASFRRGDTDKENQSCKDIQWLILKEREIEHRIIHAGHEREYQLIEDIDRYYENEDETQRHVLHGCFFHGCPTCYRINCYKPIGNSKETFDT